MSTFINDFGERGSGNGQLLYPNGIAVDSNGNIYIVDAGNARVQKFDRTGIFIEPGAGERNPFNGSDNALGLLVKPTKIAITTKSSSNKVYVIDEENVVGKALIVFTTEGNFVVNLNVPFGTDVTKLTPRIVASSGATVAPSSGFAEDFTNPVTYTVTGQDGSTQSYKVTVNVMPAQK